MRVFVAAAFLLPGCAQTVGVHAGPFPASRMRVDRADLVRGPNEGVSIVLVPAGVNSEARSIRLELRGPCATTLTPVVSFDQALFPGPSEGRILNSSVRYGCEPRPSLSGRIWGLGAFVSPEAREYFLIEIDEDIRLEDRSRHR